MNRFCFCKLVVKTHQDAIQQTTNGNKFLQFAKRRDISVSLIQPTKVLPMTIIMKICGQLDILLRIIAELCLPNHSPKISDFMEKEQDVYQWFVQITKNN
jgi:hypothetical protein